MEATCWCLILEQAGYCIYDTFCLNKRTSNLQIENKVQISLRILNFCLAEIQRCLIVFASYMNQTGLITIIDTYDVTSKSDRIYSSILQVNRNLLQIQLLKGSKTLHRYTPLIILNILKQFFIGK